MDLESVISQVLYNCDVTDAQHAGIYSVCGLAMRLRDLYKWEHRLSPWQEDEPSKVLDWIGAKEDLWETLTEATYAPLELDGRTFDAFDAPAVNEILQPHDLYYGAGYAYSLKPTFFLARIVETRRVAGHRVWILGPELARDLLTLPAFSQNGQAVLRTEASRMFLWDQIAYMNNSGRRALEYALRAVGLPDVRPETIQARFDELWGVQARIYIHHEVGELEDDNFPGDAWRRMLADHAHTTVELLIRTLKDLLADTAPHGALSRLTEERDHAALGLYLAFGKGWFSMLCAELIGAFDIFVEDGDWTRIAAAAHQIRDSVAAYAREILGLHASHREDKGVAWCREAIEKTMRRRGLLDQGGAPSK